MWPLVSGNVYLRTSRAVYHKIFSVKLPAVLICCQSFLLYNTYLAICNAYYACMSITFTDLPTVTNARNTSRICVTSLNISWDVPSITCGDVSYEVSISPPPIEGDAVVTTVDRFLSVTGLNNSLPDVTITVTAVNRVGQRNGSVFSVQLPRSLGKCCT